MGVKFNPFTGTFDFTGSGSSSSSPDNFSYNHIQTSETVTIPEGQQMLYFGDLTIDGDLYLEGDAIEIRDDSYQTMPVSYIGPSDLYLVPVNRVLFFRNLTIDGILRLDGDLVEV